MLLPLFLWVAPIAAQLSPDTETDHVLQRNAAIQALRSQKPIQGVRKMSDDEGEKFFLDYWRLEENDTVFANDTEAQGADGRVVPRSYPFTPPFSLGSNIGVRIARRDFRCPAGTYGCTSINRPDSCCRTDETCVVVEDTGSGDVGCCPAGLDCSGTIGSCWEGYTSCPSSLGGGCCIPGYECVSEGCVRVFTVTVTVNSTVITTTSTETIPPSTTSGTPITTTTTTTESSSSSTSTGDLVPPARPTSTLTTTTSDAESMCPTGFYACSAIYHGGCCRTGRDCDTTSCPAISSTTVVSNDLTIIAPEATTSAASSGERTGRCARGWFSCADTVGGGCCPTGYACGSSCTAVPTASTTGTVAKEAPTAGGSSMRVGWEVLMCVVMGITWMMA